MKRFGCTMLCLLATAGLFRPSSVSAQSDPDLREIPPLLMLVIDSSGSMERLTSCACTTPSCEECLPNCALANDSNGVPPKDSNGHDLKKNRWAITLEALTGTFNNFQCEPLARTSGNGMTYDLGYPLPYHQPWDCSGQQPGTACASTPTVFSTPPGVSTLNQNANGVIDLYGAHLQFGLMVFDGLATYVGAPPLVAASAFDVNASNAVQGLWSYAGGKTFHYPNCTTDYMEDDGVRSAAATEGALVSLNSCSGAVGTAGCPSWCSACGTSRTQVSLSQDIQATLLRTRPYGGTPIAASLDDLYYHLKNDNADSFATCRHRFALLVTDGYPDDDYRSFGCNCAVDENPSSPNYCGGPPNDPTKMHCPYPTAEQAASDLIKGRSGDNPMIDQLYVVGLAVDDATVLTRLDAIAHAGCPSAAGCDPDGDTHEALFANDVDHLVQNLSAVIDPLFPAISRSVPAFATGGTANGTNGQQYQLSTGFKVATRTGQPWTGLLERRRFTCSSGSLTEVDLNSSDKFHDLLNSQQTRNLYTVAPSGVSSLDSTLYSGASGDPCGTTGCTNLALASVSPTRYGLIGTDTAGRTQIVDWMQGASNTVRATKKLGDIFHSSPVVVGAPRFDTADDAFNRFRQRTDVPIATRPLTLFVGSNDGILHAFSVENYSPTTGTSYTAGQEMWGFVPPMFLDNLGTNLNTHQTTMDGTPVVKNVYFSKAKGLDATGYEYHTVLIVGMREGGNAYIALDVTDVRTPKFLWQFTDPHMGLTFGQAAIGQATFKDMSTGQPVTKNGAVAILPGGVGQAGVSGVSGDCTNGTTNPSMRYSSNLAFTSDLDVPTAAAPTPTTSPHRSSVRCWKDIGRALYFVDVENGRLLKKIHADASGKLIFPSPLVSTPALFESDIGTIASRAFITDADGVIWRADLSASDQDENTGHTKPLTGWTARPFHDIFSGVTSSPATAGELSYEAPLMSVDPNGNLVIIVGTGDNNNFVKPSVNNRVVSLTEALTISPAPQGRPEDYRAAVNWELRTGSNTLDLGASELVTGSMGLFNGQLYFATFMAVTSSNACDYGRARIHAVDYIARDTTVTYSSPATYGPRRFTTTELGLDTSAQTAINVAASAGLLNQMVMGVGVTERPTCQTVDTEDFSVWGQSTYGVKTLGQPSIYLVAQASGGTSVGSLVQKHAGSALGSIEIRLNKRTSLSRVTSWATSVD